MGIHRFWLIFDGGLQSGGLQSGRPTVHSFSLEMYDFQLIDCDWFWFVILIDFWWGPTVWGPAVWGLIVCATDFASTHPLTCLGTIWRTIQPTGCLGNVIYNIIFDYFEVNARRQLQNGRLVFLLGHSPWPNNRTSQIPEPETPMLWPPLSESYFRNSLCLLTNMAINSSCLFTTYIV